MIKFLEKALENYSFKYEKISGYGEINGYEVNVVYYATSNGPTFFFSTYLPEDKKIELLQKFRAQKIKRVAIDVTPYGVAFQITALTGGNFVKNFPETLEKILQLLDQAGGQRKDICPVTGVEMTEENSSIINVSGNIVKVRLTHDAVNKINTEITTTNEEFKNAPNNYLKGFFGVLLGAIAGVILTIIFDLLGYVSALSSLIAIYLGVFLYKKFGGKPNGVMILMSMVTTFICIFGYILFSFVDVPVNFKSHPVFVAAPSKQLL